MVFLGTDQVVVDEWSMAADLGAYALESIQDDVDPKRGSLGLASGQGVPEDVASETEVVSEKPALVDEASGASQGWLAPSVSEAFSVASLVLFPVDVEWE